MGFAAIAGGGVEYDTCMYLGSVSNGDVKQNTTPHAHQVIIVVETYVQADNLNLVGDSELGVHIGPSNPPADGVGVVQSYPGLNGLTPGVSGSLRSKGVLSFTVPAGWYWKVNTAYNGSGQAATGQALCISHGDPVYPGESGF